MNNWPNSYNAYAGYIPPNAPQQSHLPGFLPAYPPRMSAPVQGAVCTGGGASGRRSRTVFNVHSTRFLEAEFEQNAYPDYETRCYYGCLLCVAEDRIQVWFQNKRSRSQGKKLNRGPPRTAPRRMAIPPVISPDSTSSARSPRSNVVLSDLSPNPTPSEAVAACSTTPSVRPDLALCSSTPLGSPACSSPAACYGSMSVPPPPCQATPSPNFLNPQPYTPQPPPNQHEKRKLPYNGETTGAKHPRGNNSNTSYYCQAPPPAYVSACLARPTIASYPQLNTDDVFTDSMPPSESGAVSEARNAKVTSSGPAYTSRRPPSLRLDSLDLPLNTPTNSNSFSPLWNVPFSPFMSLPSPFTLPGTPIN